MTQMIPADFQVFVTEFKAADDDFNAGRSAQAAASGAYQNMLAANDAWLAMVKAVLLGAFGTGYTTQWAQAGFINNTTALPRKVADRVALTGRLTAFFTRSPGYEVPTMNVTAAEGTALGSAIAAAQGTLTAATRPPATERPPTATTPATATPRPRPPSSPAWMTGKQWAGHLGWNEANRERGTDRGNGKSGRCQFFDTPTDNHAREAGASQRAETGVERRA